MQMKNEVQIDLSDRTLWGLKGNVWYFFSYNLVIVKPYDGDGMTLKAHVINGELFRDGCVAWALHRKSRVPGVSYDTYNIDDVMSTFTRCSVHNWNGAIAEMRLSRQHIAYLEALEKEDQIWMMEE